MNAPTLTRRAFTAGLSGFVIAFSLRPPLAGAQAARLPGSLNNNRMLDAWLRINADGTATIFSGKVELGQGILTALRQVAAEELDLPLARVAIISGDTAQTPDEGHTSGSQSLEFGGTAVRLACAEARAALLELAAKRTGWSADTLTVTEGVITAPNGSRATYGELAGDVDLRHEASAQVKPRPAGMHKIVGTAVPRQDIPAKVTGAAAYVQDVRLPGMVHARVVRPPRMGAKLIRIDETTTKALPGVLAVVRDGSFLGVICEREEQAINAREALRESARWEGGKDLPDPDKLYEHLTSLKSQDSVLGEKQGPALAGNATVLEATYTKPYIAHGSIGPSCALAEFKDNKLTVWSHTQGVFPLRRDLARALKMDVAAIRCIHVEGSGCYGHNGADDVALDAALLARATPGKPVRVQWMRDDEMAWAPYGAAMVMKAKAALLDGKIADWNYELWSNTHSTRPGDAQGTNLLAAWYLAEPQPPAPPRGIPQPAGGGDRNAVPLYDFPRQRILHHFIPEMPLRVSALRTLGGYANVFAVESFLDELAAAAGADPVAFRLAHMKDERARTVIEAAAKAAGWNAGEKGDGRRGRGIAFAKYKNLSTYVAVVADIEVDRGSGGIRVTHAFAAADAGQIVNPDGLRNQIEGGIVQSSSWTLHEAVQFTKDGIVSRDWQGYPILTMPEVPKLETVLIDRPNERFLGAGEASQGPTVAAIANAFAHATGKRLRDLPLSPAKVKAILA